jgi:hypothetical protein
MECLDRLAVDSELRSVFLGGDDGSGGGGFGSRTCLGNEDVTTSMASA